MSRSPIEIMIDRACGCEPEKTLPRLTDEQKQAASDLARDVIDHIDEMYPAMWHNVPKSARASVRNTIINRVRLLLQKQP